MRIENSFDVVNELSVSDRIRILFFTPLLAVFELAANSITPLLGFGRVLSSLSITSQDDGSCIEKSLFLNLNNHSVSAEVPSLSQQDERNKSERTTINIFFHIIEES